MLQHPPAGAEGAPELIDAHAGEASRLFTQYWSALTTSPIERVDSFW